MDEEVIALAGLAATTLVKLMATDLWGQAKGAMAGVFNRKSSKIADITDDMDKSRDELEIAHEQGDELTEGELVEQWRGRFRRLLGADPAAAAALRTVLDELTPHVPGGASSGQVHLEAKAKGHARIYQAGRDQHIS